MDAAIETETPPIAATGLVPLLVGLAAPGSVLTALAVTSNALAAFAVYHVGACLLVPLAALHLSEHTWPQVQAHLGLRWPSREGWLAGIGVGAAMGLAILASAFVFRSTIAAASLADRLAAWGIAGSPAALFAYMLVFNSGAEELFWRGYLHTEAVGRLGPVLGIGMVTVAFASYHLYTLLALLPHARLALAGTVAVFAGGLVWAGLRERYASVVPALLAHGGATAGYMTVYVAFV